MNRPSFSALNLTSILFGETTFFWKCVGTLSPSVMVAVILFRMMPFRADLDEVTDSRIELPTLRFWRSVTSSRVRSSGNMLLWHTTPRRLVRSPSCWRFGANSMSQSGISSMSAPQAPSSPPSPRRFVTTS